MILGRDPTNWAYTRIESGDDSSGGRLFQGTLYVVVFLICAIVFAKVRSRNARQAVLLVASYALLHLGTMAGHRSNHFHGHELSCRSMAAVKTTRLLLASSFFLNLALLGTFKYLPEFAIHGHLGALQGLSRLALPLGISFWTLEALSYHFDLYRGEELDPSLVEFALYMAFFPVAISGPVCRMPEMLPSFAPSKRPHGMISATGCAASQSGY